MLAYARLYEVARCAYRGVACLTFRWPTVLQSCSHFYFLIASFTYCIENRAEVISGRCYIEVPNVCPSPLFPALSPFSLSYLSDYPCKTCLSKRSKNTKMRELCDHAVLRVFAISLLSVVFLMSIFVSAVTTLMLIQRTLEQNTLWPFMCLLVTVSHYTIYSTRLHLTWCRLESQS